MQEQLSCVPRDLRFQCNKDLSYRRDDKISCILRLKNLNMFSICGLYTVMLKNSCCLRINDSQNIKSLYKSIIYTFLYMIG